MVPALPAVDTVFTVGVRSGPRTSVTSCCRQGLHEQTTVGCLGLPVVLHHSSDQRILVKYSLLREEGNLR